MLAAQTDLQHAQKVKEALMAKNVLHPNYVIVKEFNFIYFPIVRRVNVTKAKIVNTKFLFPQRNKPLTVEELLKDKLTKKELQLLPHSQEIVGTILILEIPKELKKKEKIIAQAFLQSNKSIETVVRKDEIHSGDYRLRKVKILAGKNSTETTHKENGVSIKLDLEKTYFSAKLANERLRIAKQIKKGEEALVLFSGAGPYPLVLARNSPAKIIYGIELNPIAFSYAVDNVALNNLTSRIVLKEGDVRKILPGIPKKFDRIAMPLPKTGEQFLGIALSKAKPGAIIHLYAFVSEEEIPGEKKKIKEISKKNHYSVKVLRTVKCGQFSPYVHRVCFDLKVIKR